jgi:SPP1 family phage portal protein
MIDTNSITSEDLNNLRKTIDLNTIAKNEAYYDGKNPPILSEADKKKPDNKIPVAIGYRLISNLSGFAARTGDIFINQVPEEGEDKNDSDFEKMRQDIDKENNGLLLNSQLYVQTLKQGISYDVVWTAREGETLKIYYAQIPNVQAAPIWSNELSTVKKMAGFVRFWSESKIVGSSDPEHSKGGEMAQVFIKGGYQKFQKQGDGDESRWVPYEDFVKQPFDMVQVSAYRGNKKARAYIDPVTVLIDQYDKVISRNMNEVERFNNALLAVLKKISVEDKNKVDEMGVIDNLIEGIESNPSGAVFPQFITRDVPTTHAEMMINTLSTLIYEIMGSPNFTAESFGTASGIALLYRLIGLEYAAAETDVWYDQGLMNRNDLINQALRNRENKPTIDQGFTPVIVHNRNLPVDISFLAENALKLKAIGVSTETILKLFPKNVINDVKAEMERIEEERKSITPPSGVIEGAETI